MLAQHHVCLTSLIARVRGENGQAALPTKQAQERSVYARAAAVCAGTQGSTYNITKQASDGGAACPATDGQVRTRECNATESCLVDCVGSWVAGPCEGVCGIGWMTYTYNVTVPARNGGKNCSRPNGTTSDDQCYLEVACPPCTLTGVQANVIVGPSCGSNWRPGQACTLSCPDSYTPTGSATLSCPRYSATVSASGFSCAPNPCTVIDAQANVNTSDCGNSWVPGQNCTLTCPPNYTPTGNALTCNEPGAAIDASGVLCNPVVCTGAIQALDSSGTSLGYISNSMFLDVAYTSTANFSAALNVSFSPASPPFDIRQHSNPSKNNFLGLVQASGGDLGPGSPSYRVLTATNPTAPNAYPASTVGNAFNGILISQSAVWSFNASNNELMPQWVNSNGSKPTTTTPFLDRIASGGNYFGVGGDIAALNQQSITSSFIVVSLHFVVYVHSTARVNTVVHLPCMHA